MLKFEERIHYLNYIEKFIILVDKKKQLNIYSIATYNNVKYAFKFIYSNTC